MVLNAFGSGFGEFEALRGFKNHEFDFSQCFVFRVLDVYLDSSISP